MASSSSSAGSRVGHPCLQILEPLHLFQWVDHATCFSDVIWIFKKALTQSVLELSHEGMTLTRKIEIKFGQGSSIFLFLQRLTNVLNSPSPSLTSSSSTSIVPQPISYDPSLPSLEGSSQLVEYDPSVPTPFGSSSVGLQPEAYDPASPQIGDPRGNLIGFLMNQSVDIKSEWIQQEPRQSVMRDLVLRETWNQFREVLESEETFEPLVYFNGSSTEIFATRGCFLNKLLHVALLTNKPNFARYFIQKGAEVNSDVGDHASAALMALNLILDSQTDIKRTSDAFSVFEAILEQRKPVNQSQLSEVLYFCSQHYLGGQNASDRLFNMKLFDEALSIFLGQQIDFWSFFNDHRETFLKFVAHIYSFGGTHEDSLLKDHHEYWKSYGYLEPGEIPLEGIFPSKYMQLRLRLYLQNLYENKIKGNLDDIYNEFLCELETAWVYELLYHWRQLPFNEELTRRFCQVLSKYITRQIVSLQNNQEFCLQTGWDHHSICIGFCKKGDKINIRVDNLGFGINPHHHTEFHAGRYRVKPKLLGVLDKSKENQIQRYVHILIDHICNAKWTTELSSNRDQTTDSILQNIYKPNLDFDLLDDSQLTQESDWYPGQIVGNCTFASFNSGVIERIGQSTASHIIEAEVGLLHQMFNLWEQWSIGSLSPLERAPKWISDHIDYLSYLRYQLRKLYKSIYDSNKLPYFMEPTGKLDENSTIGVNDFLLSQISKYQSNNTDRYLIRIHGKAGAGKTVLTQYLSHALLFNDSLTDLVILIRLNKLSKDELYPERESYSLVDMISKEIFERDLELYERKLLLEIIDNKKIIWIFDGMDEFLPNLPWFKEAMEKLESHRVIITSRSNVEHEYFKKISASVELVDYSSHEITCYIDQALDGTDSSVSELKQKFKNTLRESIEFREICQIPIILSWICKMLKTGETEILNKRNFAEIFEDFISFSCKRAYRRELKRLFIDGKGKDIDQINKKKIVHYYRVALRFMQQIANDKGPQSVQCSSEDFNEALTRRNESISDCDELRKDLNNIGLFIPDSHGGGFVHRLFQEYFVARGLIKKIRRVATSSNGIEIIENYKWSQSYHYVFLFVVHRLLHSMKTKPRTATETKQFLLNFLNKFIVEDSLQPINNNKIQQIVPLINVYCRHFLGRDQEYFEVTNWCREPFQSMLSHIREKQILSEESLDDEERWDKSRKALEVFFQIFADHRPLRQAINLKEQILGLINSRLEQSTSSSSSSTVEQLDEKSVEILRRCFLIIEWSHIVDHDVVNHLKLISERFGSNYNIISGLTMILLGYVSKVAEGIGVTTETDQLLGEVETMLDSLFILIKAPWEVQIEDRKRRNRERENGLPQHTEVAQKIVNVLTVVHDSHIRTPKIESISEKLKVHLVKLTKQMLEHLSLNWIKHWQGVSSIDQNILNWRDCLALEEINRLKDFITTVYNFAYGEGELYFKLNLGNDRDFQYRCLENLLKNTVNFIDLFDVEYGDLLVDKVITIASEGVTGHVKRRGLARGDNESRAKNVLLGYRPDLIAAPSRQLERLERICSSIENDEGILLIRHLETLKKVFSKDPERRDLITNTLEKFRNIPKKRFKTRYVFASRVEAGPITKQYSDLPVIRIIEHKGKKRNSQKGQVLGSMFSQRGHARFRRN